MARTADGTKHPGQIGTASSSTSSSASENLYDTAQSTSSNVFHKYPYFKTGKQGIASHFYNNVNYDDEEDDVAEDEDDSKEEEIGHEQMDPNFPVELLDQSDEFDDDIDFGNDDIDDDDDDDVDVDADVEIEYDEDAENYIYDDDDDDYGDDDDDDVNDFDAAAGKKSYVQNVAYVVDNLEFNDRGEHELLNAGEKESYFQLKPRGKVNMAARRVNTDESNQQGSVHAPDTYSQNKRHASVNSRGEGAARYPKVDYSVAGGYSKNNASDGLGWREGAGRYPQSDDVGVTYGYHPQNDGYGHRAGAVKYQQGDGGYLGNETVDGFSVKRGARRYEDEEEAGVDSKSSDSSLNKDDLVPIVCSSSGYFWERKKYESGKTLGVRLQRYINYICNLEDEASGRLDNDLSDAAVEAARRLKEAMEDGAVNDEAFEEEDDDAAHENNVDDVDMSESNDVNNQNWFHRRRRRPESSDYGHDDGGRSNARNNTRRQTTSSPTMNTSYFPNRSAASRTATASLPTNSQPLPQTNNFASTLKFWRGVERIMVPHFVREAASLLSESETSTDNSDSEDHFCFGDTGNTSQSYRHNYHWRESELTLPPIENIGFGDGETLIVQSRAASHRVPKIRRCLLCFWWCLTILFLSFLVVLLFSENVYPGIFSKHISCECHNILSLFSSVTNEEHYSEGNL